jgi:hypothetical protein
VSASTEGRAERAYGSAHGGDGRRSEEVGDAATGTARAGSASGTSSLVTHGVQGIVGGLAGGVAFGVMMTVMGMMPMVAMLRCSP